jgi:formate/nitrite transporter FocA (FNT family)
MFTIPLGIFLTSGTPDALTVFGMINNLIPVIAGNFVGAAVFVGLGQYYLTMDSKGSSSLPKA